MYFYAETFIFKLSENVELCFASCNIFLHFFHFWKFEVFINFVIVDIWNEPNSMFQTLQMKVGILGDRSLNGKKREKLWNRLIKLDSTGQPTEVWINMRNGKEILSFPENMKLKSGGRLPLVSKAIRHQQVIQM